jgi:prepilin-type N-terminal cleavage/methylation domain-containing protein
MRRKRSGFTLIELLVVVAIIALLISILLPSLARARELAKRVVCMSNLKGIGNSCHIYANENFDLFPVAPHNQSSVTFVGAIGTKGSAAIAGGVGEDFNLNDSQVSTTGCMWILVREGGTSPGQFFCPSSNDEKDATERTGSMYDFTGYNTVSYGFQIPFNVRNNARPGSSADPRLAVAADKGPYAEIGTQLGQATSGQVGFSERQTTPTAAAGYPQPNTQLDLYRPYNSPNHGGRGDGEGQNVLYADSHAEFTKVPEAGAEGDNIYTMGPTFTGNEGGIPQSGMYPGRDGAQFSGTNDSPTDTLIWP